VKQVRAHTKFISNSNFQHATQPKLHQLQHKLPAGVADSL